MRSVLAVLLLVATTIGADSAQARIIRVPQDEPTIRSGIGAADIGDTVMVSCGTYHEIGLEIFHGLYLLSETGDPACVRLDAYWEDNRLISINTGAARDPVVISGFTFTHGDPPASAQGGGALSTSGCALTVRNCDFVHNRANSTLPTTGGGAVFLGGGSSSSSRFYNCNFLDNQSLAAGGAIRCTGTSPIFINCQFSRNLASTFGGAVFAYQTSAPAVELSLFSENTAQRGGAVACIQSTPSLSGCTLFANSAEDGGGLFVADANAVLWRTIVSHSSQGEAISCSESGPYPPGSATLTCSDLYANSGGDWVGCISGQLGTEGNISADPLFCDPSQGNFQIRTDSPCAPANSGGCDLIGAYGVGCTVPTGITDSPLQQTTWGAIKRTFQ